MPAEGPVLRTESSKVAPGGKIRANCTTPGSYPAMNVTWIINDEEVSELPTFNYLYDTKQKVSNIASSS